MGSLEPISAIRYLIPRASLFPARPAVRRRLSAFLQRLRTVLYRVPRPTLTPPAQLGRKRAVTSAQPDLSPAQTGSRRVAAIDRCDHRDRGDDCAADRLCRPDRPAYRRGLLLDVVEGACAVLPRPSADDRLVHPVWNRDLRRHQSRRQVRRHSGDAGDAVAARRSGPPRHPRYPRDRARGPDAGGRALLWPVDVQGRARHGADPVRRRDDVVAGQAQREQGPALVAGRGIVRRAVAAVEIHRHHAAAGGRSVRVGAGLATPLADEPLSLARRADCNHRVPAGADLECAA